MLRQILEETRPITIHCLGKTEVMERTPAVKKYYSLYQQEYEKDPDSELTKRYLTVWQDLVTFQSEAWDT